MDSPRYLRGLAERIDNLGGIRHVLLSHRDDVADADRWAERYGSQVYIHAADADAAPYATTIFGGDLPVAISPGVTAVPVPGHTEGSVVFHVDDRWLFTGDTLHWNHRRSELDVTPEQTFYSWEVLADSMDRLAQLRVEWVFAGHGKWHEVGTDAYTKQMTSLGDDMRRIGQVGWAQRSGAAFDWH